MKFGLIGYNGRMCQAIKSLIKDDENVISYHKNCGKQMIDVFNKSDVVIDFSSPDGLNEAIDCALITKKPLLTGTTGFDEILAKKLNDAGKLTKILWTSNTSLGVYLLKEISVKLSRVLSDYDIDICETHHYRKADNPSGTALSIATTIAKENEGLKILCNSSSKREPNELRISGTRRGDVIGEHSVIFSSDMDEIEIKHKAFNRDIFAKSAIKIAEKLAEIEHFDKLLTIDDIYGL